MEEKINLVELLKDCPKGMELDCINYDGIVTFNKITNCERYPISINVSYNDEDDCIALTKYGQTSNSSYNKCIIFPKGKNSWEGFQKPFKDGDIVATDTGYWIGITEGGIKDSFIPTYCVIKGNGQFEAYFDEKRKWRFNRLATEEEKAKLFQVIKDNGYKWNSETKTLEKIEPKFKVGDKIKKKDNTHLITIKDVKDGYYNIKIIYCNISDKLSFNNQDDYELVSDKFDFSTLIPFESKVLVRNTNTDYWLPDVYVGRNKFDNFVVLYKICQIYKQCIPYEGNEHLLGTTNNCDKFYKVWLNI